MHSLKKRLVLAATVWIIAGIVAAGLLLSSVFHEHIREQLDDELRVHLAELQRLADVGISHFRLQRDLSDPRYDVSLSGYYWEIQRNSQIVARSASLQGGMLVMPDQANQDLDVHTHVVAGPTGPLIVAERVRWDKPTDTPIRFIIGTDVRHLTAVQQAFDEHLVYALTALGLSMVGAAVLLLLYAIKPLDQLRAGLLRVRRGSEKRLQGTFPSEVQPLVDDLNTLLGSTSDLVQRARTQAGNIAHTLKTPLAILIDEARNIANKGDQQSAAVIREQCLTMQRQIDYQTARARAAAVRSVPGVLSPVREPGEEVATALARVHRDKTIAIETDLADGLVVACDRRDLHEMLANIVDNACHHALTRVRLAATAADTGRAVTITCDDDGHGLPEEAFDIVFQVGERWDSQRKGSGLGLAIVRDLAQQYGGDVKLRRSDLGGLHVALELPLADSG